MTKAKTKLGVLIILKWQKPKRPKTGVSPKKWPIARKKLGTLAQKWPNLAKNMHFWSFWSKYWNFWRISSHAWPKYNANKVPRWFYRYGLSPVKNSFFALKLHNFAQNWKFWSFWARPGRLIWCPVGWLVGGCGAWAVSRTTPIYFMYNFFVNLWLVKWETLRHLSDHF